MAQNYIAFSTHLPRALIPLKGATENESFEANQRGINSVKKEITVVTKL
jgi:hypothetical protein